jgi:hypothetical protein
MTGHGLKHGFLLKPAQFFPSLFFPHATHLPASPTALLSFLVAQQLAHLGQDAAHQRSVPLTGPGCLTRRQPGNLTQVKATVPDRTQSTKIVTNVDYPLSNLIKNLRDLISVSR